MKKIILITILISVLLFAGCSEKSRFGPYGSTHIHADFKAYIIGKPLNFGLPRYQVMDDLTHVENNGGDVIHVHATGITLRYFFKSLGFELTGECLTLDTGNRYCSLGESKLKVYLKNQDSDWELLQEPSGYIIKDLDKILVTYGPESEEEIKKQQESVTDKAKGA